MGKAKKAKGQRRLREGRNSRNAPPEPVLTNQHYNADNLETQIELLRGYETTYKANGVSFDLQKSIIACVNKARRRNGMNNRYNTLAKEIDQ
jgi:hypothetical protein